MLFANNIIRTYILIMIFAISALHASSSKTSPFYRHQCRACDSGYTLYVQDVLGNRSRQKFAQYFCMDCQSFFHTSGYKETDAQKKSDFDYLLNQKENHMAINSQLVLEIKTKVPYAKSCLEIGYGLGWFLKSCRDYGFTELYGFEVNPYCYEYATKVLGLNCALGLFDASHNRKYDLIASIMVFEHIENPRELFALMVSKLNPDGVIYLSVPFFERRDWPYLKTASTHPGNLPDLMYDNDVHINHFSIEGLIRMGKSLGAKRIEYFISQDTYWKSPGAFPGMLFYF